MLIDFTVMCMFCWISDEQSLFLNSVIPKEKNDLVFSHWKTVYTFKCFNYSKQLMCRVNHLFFVLSLLNWSKGEDYFIRLDRLHQCIYSLCTISQQVVEFPFWQLLWCMTKNSVLSWFPCIINSNGTGEIWKKCIK